jgi:hypothetical protein
VRILTLTANQIGPFHNSFADSSISEADLMLLMAVLETKLCSRTGKA